MMLVSFLESLGGFPLGIVIWITWNYLAGVGWMEKEPREEVNEGVIEEIQKYVSQ